MTPLPHEDKFLTDFLAKNQILNSEIAKRSSFTGKKPPLSPYIRKEVNNL